MPAMPQRPSLVVQTSTVLRGHLQAGMWQSRLPAERALCEQLQVSRQTLRAALAALQREGLIKLVGRMRHNMTGGQARSIKSAGRRQVTLLMPEPPEVLSPTTLLALSNLREKLGAAGYEVDLRVEPLCFGSRPNRALEKLAQTRPATVWVVWGSREPMQRWLVQRQLPALIIGSCGPGISLPSVDKDYRATCRHAGDLLWRKGHHRLALVLPRDAYDGDRDSERGFMEALDQHPEAVAHPGATFCGEMHEDSWFFPVHHVVDKGGWTNDLRRDRRQIRRQAGRCRIDDDIELLAHAIECVGGDRPLRSELRRQFLCLGQRAVGDDKLLRTLLQQGQDHAARSASSAQQQHLASLDHGTVIAHDVGDETDAVGVVAEDHIAVEFERIDRAGGLCTFGQCGGKRISLQLERHGDVGALAALGNEIAHGLRKTVDRRKHAIISQMLRSLLRETGVNFR